MAKKKQQGPGQHRSKADEAQPPELTLDDGDGRVEVDDSEDGRLLLLLPARLVHQGCAGMLKLQHTVLAKEGVSVEQSPPTWGSTTKAEYPTGNSFSRFTRRRVAGAAAAAPVAIIDLMLKEQAR